MRAIGRRRGRPRSGQSAVAKGSDMDGHDFVKLIGAESEDVDYLPVACLLTVGHAVAGYYNSAVNEDLRDSVLLLNARLTSFHEQTQPDRPWIADFADFIEEVVQSSAEQDGRVEFTDDRGVCGKSVPLVAIPLSQVAVVYPVAHIRALMTQAQEEESQVPSFFDFDNKSVVLRLLRSKLW